MEVFAATGWARFGEGAAGGAALLAVVVFPALRWGIPRMVRRLQSAFDHAVLDALERIEENSAATLRQVTANGGNTGRLADRMVRAEKNQVVIARSVGVPDDELATQTEDDEEAG